MAARGLACLAAAAIAILGAGDAAARSRQPRATPSRSSLALPPVRPGPPPAPAWARNVIIVLASGYDSAQWREARLVGAGKLALDDFTWTGYAVGFDGTPSGLARSVATGTPAGFGAPGNPPVLLNALKTSGRVTAMVSGGLPWEAASARLFGPLPESEGPDALLKARPMVLYSRAPVPAEALTAAGYTVPPDAAALVLNERTPVAAGVTSGEMMFDALVFQALHLAARNVKGFALLVDVTPDNATASELSAALATLLAYTRKERRTLMVFLDLDESGAAAVYGAGPGSEKLAGTLQATDIPKIIAGMAHAPFRRDFSAQYLSRKAALQR